jgi:hypothetical protein
MRTGPFAVAAAPAVFLSVSVDFLKYLHLQSWGCNLSLHSAFRKLPAQMPVSAAVVVTELLL